MKKKHIIHFSYMKNIWLTFFWPKLKSCFKESKRIFKTHVKSSKNIVKIVLNINCSIAKCLSYNFHIWNYYDQKFFWPELKSCFYWAERFKNYKKFYSRKIRNRKSRNFTISIFIFWTSTRVISSNPAFVDYSCVSQQRTCQGQLIPAGDVSRLNSLLESKNSKYFTGSRRTEPTHHNENVASCKKDFI